VAYHGAYRGDYRGHGDRPLIGASTGLSGPTCSTTVAPGNGVPARGQRVGITDVGQARTSPSPGKEVATYPTLRGGGGQDDLPARRGRAKRGRPAGTVAGGGATRSDKPGARDVLTRIARRRGRPGPAPASAWTSAPNSTAGRRGQTRRPPAGQARTAAQHVLAGYGRASY